MRATDERFGDLLAALERSDSTFVWASALAHALVAFNQTAPPRPSTRRELESIHEARMEFRSVLRADEHSQWPALLDIARRKALMSVLIQEADIIGAPAAVHELLFAIDEELGRGLGIAARASGTLVVGPGDAAPVSCIDLHSVLGTGGFVARPSRKASGLGRLNHLCILPPLGKYRVTFEFRYPALFAPFIDEPIVAVAVPNVGRFETAFRFEPKLDIDRFFGVAPKDEAAQQRCILALLELADLHGARLVLLPELSTSAAIASAIDAWLAAPRRSVATVIAGSYHGQEGSTRYNRAPVFGLGAQAAGLYHDKFSAYDHPYTGGVVLREDLDPVSPHINVYVSRGQTLGVLICKDLLSEQLLPALLALRLNYLAVVAFSSETASFRNIGAALAEAGQTTTVIANFSGRAPEQESAALAVLPTAGEAVFEHAAKNLDKPSILLMNIRKRHAGWQVHNPI